MNEFIYVIIILSFYRILRYLTTPIFRKLGIYKYYSPLFFIMLWFGNSMDVHLGTSWDYFKLKDKSPRKIFYYVAKGFYNLINSINKGEIDKDTVIKGNIHYLSDSTLDKFGFKYRRLNMFELLLFSLNYIELCILKSITYKKIIFVPLNEIKIAYIKAGELITKKEKFEKFLSRMNGKDRVRYEEKPIISKENVA